MDKTVLIFGARGRLGRLLSLKMENEGWSVIKTSRTKEMDYTVDPVNPIEVNKCISACKPCCIVNLHAMTDVDLCETSKVLAVNENTMVPRNISMATEVLSQNIHVVHISTDQVYEGVGNHIEDLTGPLNVYGLSKLAGEYFLQGISATIFRTNFFGMSLSANRPSFSDWAVKMLTGSSEFPVFTDIKFNALHTSTLCNLITYAASERLKGTFNLGTSTSISKADFCISLADNLNCGHALMKKTLSGSSTKRARRPLDMTMNIKYFENTTNLKLPTIQQEISKTSQEYLNAKS